MTVDTSTVCHEHRNYLRRYIERRVSNKEDAEDILQDIFVAIQKNISNLKDVDAVRPWVTQIARNQIVDYYRLHKATQPLNEDVSIGETEAGNENYAISLCLKNMIDDLPVKYQQAIKLTTYQGLSQKQVAAELGLSISGAKSRVQRSRSFLKKMLERCCQLEFDCMGNIIDYKQKGLIKRC